MIAGRNEQKATRLVRSLAICAALIATNLTTGCIELGIITPIGTSTDTPTETPTSSPTDDGDTSTVDPVDETQLPTATLSVTNPTPQPDEEVTLTCRVASGDDTDALFDFNANQQPGTGLNINRSAGLATFIVSESDVGSSFTFTCSVTTDAGESAPSSPKLVTPSG